MQIRSEAWQVTGILVKKRDDKVSDDIADFDFHGEWLL